MGEVGEYIGEVGEYVGEVGEYTGKVVICDSCTQRLFLCAALLFVSLSRSLCLSLDFEV